MVTGDSTHSWGQKVNDLAPSAMHSKAPSLLFLTRASQPWCNSPKILLCIPESLPDSSLPPSYVEMTPSWDMDARPHTHIYTHAHTRPPGKRCDNGEGEGCPFVLCPALGAQTHTKSFTEGFWLPEGEVNGGSREGGEGRPQSRNAQLVGLGSKMGAVLTGTESAKDLRGKGKQGAGDGTHYSGDREKGRARGGFQEAIRNANLLKAI